MHQVCVQCFYVNQVVFEHFFPYHTRMNTKPLLIGHRGCFYKGFNQNTIRAYKKVIDEGISAIEFDVQLTADKRLVLIHDASLNNISTGSGLVSDASFSCISTLNAGDPQRGRDSIPLLEELLDLTASLPESDRPVMHLELKSRGAGESSALMVNSWIEEGLLRPCDFIISSFNWLEVDSYTFHDRFSLSTALISGAVKREDFFRQLPDNHEEIVKVEALFKDDFFIALFTDMAENRAFIDNLIQDQALRDRLYDIASGTLDGSVYTDSLIEAALARKAVAINLWHYSAPVSFVKKAQNAGLKVNLYTVNEPEDIEKWAVAGIDGLYTDYYHDVKILLDGLFRS